MLDVTFAEDASRIRQQQAPQTSAVLRRLAVSILSQDTMVRDTLRGKRYRACLSTDVLERMREYHGLQDVVRGALTSVGPID